jgi:large subunit ribosomal protein L25
VREKQRDFIRGTLLHVDFQAVSLTEKIRTSVSIELFGSSPAVKDLNGLVFLNLDELEIECLPQDLPEMVRVDISGLATIGSSIHVRDINLGSAITVFDDPNVIIAVVNLAGKEEEVVEVTEEVVVAEPEVIERGKKEEEAAEE